MSRPLPDGAAVFVHERHELAVDVVARPSVDAALESALARARLVLLCAPAGYSKTTALVQQLARPVPAA